MELIGKKFVNRFNSIYTVIEKLDKRYYIIEFDESKYKCKKRRDHIIKGEVKCPYDKTINSICCKGERKYCGKLEDGTELVWRYVKWNHNKKYKILNDTMDNM